MVRGHPTRRLIAVFAVAAAGFHVATFTLSSSEDVLRKE